MYALVGLGFVRNLPIKIIKNAFILPQNLLLVVIISSSQQGFQ